MKHMNSALQPKRPKFPQSSVLRQGKEAIKEYRNSKRAWVKNMNSALKSKRSTFPKNLVPEMQEI